MLYPSGYVRNLDIVHNLYILFSIPKKSSFILLNSSMPKNEDINRDGTISQEEVEVAKQKTDIKIVEDKAETQKYMAWVALVSMSLLTGVMFTPLVAESRVHALGDLIGLFYISMAGIVGAYMGITAYMNMPSKTP